MIKSLAAVLVLLPASSWALQGKSVSDHVALREGKEIRIVVDSGDLILEASSAPTLSYQVDFVSESYGLFHSGPSQKAYDRSDASYDREAGVLKIHADDGLVAKGRIYVPSQEALEVTIQNGKASISARPGKTSVEMDNGLLTFDASKVPAGCFQTVVDNGWARGRSASSCAAPTAILHLKNGILTVE